MTIDNKIAQLSLEHIDLPPAEYEQIYKNLQLPDDILLFFLTTYATANSNSQNGLKNIEYLLQLCVQRDMNIINHREKSSGLTLLHIAAARGKLEFAALLLSAGANPNVIDDENKTPLFYALRNTQYAQYKTPETRYAVASLLISKGALISPDLFVFFKNDDTFQQLLTEQQLQREDRQVLLDRIAALEKENARLKSMIDASSEKDKSSAPRKSMFG